LNTDDLKYSKNYLPNVGNPQRTFARTRAALQHTEATIHCDMINETDGSMCHEITYPAGNSCDATAKLPGIAPIC